MYVGACYALPAQKGGILIAILKIIGVVFELFCVWLLVNAWW